MASDDPETDSAPREPSLDSQQPGPLSDQGPKSGSNSPGTSTSPASDSSGPGVSPPNNQPHEDDNPGDKPESGSSDNLGHHGVVSLTSKHRDSAAVDDPDGALAATVVSGSITLKPGEATIVNGDTLSLETGGNVVVGTTTVALSSAPTRFENIAWSAVPASFPTSEGPALMVVSGSISIAPGDSTVINGEKIFFGPDGRVVVGSSTVAVGSEETGVGGISWSIEDFHLPETRTPGNTSGEDSRTVSDVSIATRIETGTETGAPKSSGDQSGPGSDTQRLEVTTARDSASQDLTVRPSIGNGSTAGGGGSALSTSTTVSAGARMVRGYSILLSFLTICTVFKL